MINIEIIDFRNFAYGKQKKVDDEIYGGGSGMLLKIEPIDLALENTKGKRILLSPQGKPFTQDDALKLSKEENLTFICGRYEGFDERIRNLIDEEYSIGDYVLTGGELASMVIADSTIRLIPGVIKEESYKNDSFQNNLLDYPQYTRPATYKNMNVPEVLLNGNHKEIKQWREQKAYEKTLKNRPDLIERKNNAK
ncbi:tRNA (guanine-N1)-methyltransferase [Mycoplasma mobile 163K]|uniref:tRNA (guanine-N(1)-)-methyltransferase n=1 Tax=Mycoplasma mobile (strain ATCC 43663 / 163K / NCTC 11711) TaxID=267748 RepID=TRMD_MYCM1|nr:RecName: Full=tRNA (guanine-N(1)-)-methyltransferase; AltName: Full=M1G-methyltransferase; AltName: Full=tRNA [GM37] methyltransferase [Mycoplasma mobile 163K]AAT27915.1 tRNA (guanine-N1)-methyltransferase [Mycoplasma mobile 163K]